MDIGRKRATVIQRTSGRMIDKVAEQMVKEGKVKVDRAKEILEKLKKS